MARCPARVFVLGVLIAALSVLTGACTETTDSTLTTPTPATTTDTYSGTFAQLGAAVHPFTVTTTGTVTISLTDVAPLATMSIGVGIGTWDGTTCTSVSKNDNARAGSTALSGTVATGSYCVRVYDSGNIPDGASVTYTVQVVHP
jgi:hypothetical protein